MVKTVTFSALDVFALTTVLAGPSEDLINRLFLPLMITFSVYVPGSTIIVSPSAALFTAACIEFVAVA